MLNPMLGLVRRDLSHLKEITSNGPWERYPMLSHGKTGGIHGSVAVTSLSYLYCVILCQLRSSLMPPNCFITRPIRSSRAISPFWSVTRRREYTSGIIPVDVDVDTSF